MKVLNDVLWISILKLVALSAYVKVKSTGVPVCWCTGVLVLVYRCAGAGVPVYWCADVLVC
jgi:hypothetical protein